MATYDITSHELLSSKAKALTTEVLDAHVISAELIHDLYGTSYTGNDLLVAKLILVYQVNLQLENDQNSELYTRIVQGDREFDFRNEGVVISETARALRAKLDQMDIESKKALKQLNSSKPVVTRSSW